MSVLYITSYCSYAVVHRGEFMRPSGIEVVEVMPGKGEIQWRCAGTFYMDNLEGAIKFAEELEVKALARES